MKTKVSVIIPCYNQAQFLYDSALSALSQGEIVFEVIIINDGSTDNTSIIAHKLAHADARVKIFHQLNAGLSAARNVGLNVATGDWIQFLDSDDILYPKKIQEQVEIATKEETNLVICDYERIDEQSNRDVEGSLPYLPTFSDRIFDLYALIADWETRLSVPPHCFLINRQFLNTNNLRFNTKLPNHEDWNFWMRVLLAGVKVSEVRLVLCAYRYHSQSMSNNLTKMRDGYLAAIEDIKLLCSDDQAILALLDLKRHEIVRSYADQTNYKPKWNGRLHRWLDKLIEISHLSKINF
jgi:glycosyltransferase involved in cell wall biosynthesis